MDNIAYEITLKRSVNMNFILDFIKGIFVGIANVIPGVSGGTMAVSFGIYDKLLSAISNLLKDFKNSLKTLFPILVGMAAGIIAFTFIIPWLLENKPFITATAFSGLIIGGFPMIIKSLKESCRRDAKSKKSLNICLFVIAAALATGMLFINGSETNGSMLSADPKIMLIVFIMGIIASAAMVIPGVSGSLVLMILGYYFGIITSIKDFISALKDFDITTLIDRALVLAPFGIGCLLGIFFISKIIEWLFAHYEAATYSAISGLIAAAPFSVYYKVYEEYGYSSTKLSDVLIAIAVFIACIMLTIYIGNLDSANEEKAQTSAK